MPFALPAAQAILRSKLWLWFFCSLIDSSSHAILFCLFPFPSKRLPSSRWTLNRHVPTLPQAYLKFSLFQPFQPRMLSLDTICHTLCFPSIRQVCRMTLWLTGMACAFENYWNKRRSKIPYFVRPTRVCDSPHETPRSITVPTWIPVMLWVLRHSYSSFYA